VTGFAQLWDELAPIGRRPDGGYDRFAWTAVDAELRSWFRRTAEGIGLAVEPDRNGNLWAWWGTPGPGAVVTGSHLDSVPAGGAYDGPLGVVSALLAVADLRCRGVRPARPLAVVVFADEEGARFGVACAGSRLSTGSLDPDTARQLTDAAGTSLAGAVAAAGVDPAGLGRDEETLGRVGCFVELHVEQGRALQQPVGVATAIWPHGRWRCTFTGRADHAGTTRLVDRSDPVLPFAATALAARDAAARLGALATYGRVQVVPGGTNVVAASVTAFLDARAPDEATLTALVDDVRTAAAHHATGHGVRVELVEESRSPAVRFDAGLRDRLATLLDAPLLPTGAGHDAGVLAAHVPTAMLFVRNPTGTSHSPAETADRADCLAGVAALTAVLQELVQP